MQYIEYIVWQVIIVVDCQDQIGVLWYVVGVFEQCYVVGYECWGEEVEYLLDWKILWYYCEYVVDWFVVYVVVLGFGVD